MTSGIRFTNREMRYIALFESITGATVRDCVVNEEQDQIIFVVKEGDIGRAIGRGGKNIHVIEKMVKKRTELIEYSENPTQFLRNVLKPARINEIRITSHPNGKRIAVIDVNPKDKGRAIGKNGIKADRTRFLAKRYFQIQNISIN